jgi:adenylate kinase family enzyme
MTQSPVFASQQTLPTRIAVVGTSASGKTTLARNIAAATGIPHVELDSLHWEANWTEATDEALRERVERALQGAAWVTDGNYSKVRDLIWPRAEILVWLDYPLPVVLNRLLKRTLRRIVVREELWSGNRETIRGFLFSRDSLFLWVLQTYRKHRRTYPALLKQPEYSHLRLVHLRSPRAANAWLSHISGTAQLAPTDGNNRIPIEATVK